MWHVNFCSHCYVNSIRVLCKHIASAMCYVNKMIFINEYVFETLFFYSPYTIYFFIPTWRICVLSNTKLYHRTLLLCMFSKFAFVMPICSQQFRAIHYVLAPMCHVAAELSYADLSVVSVVNFRGGGDFRNVFFIIGMKLLWDDINNISWEGFVWIALKVVILKVERSTFGTVYHFL